MHARAGRAMSQMSAKMGVVKHNFLIEEATRQLRFKE